MYSAFLTRCIRRGEAGRLADRLNLSETGQPVEVTPEGNKERREESNYSAIPRENSTAHIALYKVQIHLRSSSSVTKM